MISGTQAAETHIFQRFLGRRAWYGYALSRVPQLCTRVPYCSSYRTSTFYGGVKWYAMLGAIITQANQIRPPSPL
jgi:hypothetical protein